MTVEAQPWNPPYEIVDVPPDKVKLAFPENYFSATIIGDHIQLSISTDAAGLPAVKERLQVLIEFAKLGPMPQRLPLFAREMEDGDIILASCDEGRRRAAGFVSDEWRGAARRCGRRPKTTATQVKKG